MKGGEANMSKNYVIHFCKNKKCNNGWLDEDLTNAKTNPPKWKYCEECCKKYGYVNPEFPPKKKLSEKQLEVIEKNKFAKRKNLTVVEEIKKGGILLPETA